MSNTNKIKTNWARFHGHVRDLPAKLKELAMVMDKHWKGTREGNNRKATAEAKVEERRQERAKAKRDLKRDIDREL